MNYSDTDNDSPLAEIMRANTGLELGPKGVELDRDGGTTTLWGDGRFDGVRYCQRPSCGSVIENGSEMERLDDSGGNARGRMRWETHYDIVRVYLIDPSDPDGDDCPEEQCICKDCGDDWHDVIEAAKLLDSDARAERKAVVDALLALSDSEREERRMVLEGMS